MSENSEIKLSLLDEESVSDLKKVIFQEELKEINNKYPLQEDCFDIHSTYFLKNENFLEVGIFIRNTAKKGISLNEMPLIVQDSEGNTILSQNMNFKPMGLIPSNTGRPFEVKFDLSDIKTFDETKDYIIKFSTANEMEATNAVDTNIENLPEDMPYEIEKDILDFEKSLPPQKNGRFSIKLYKLAYDNNRALTCSLLFRNGINQEAKLDMLPVSVINKNGELIARCIFSNDEGLVKVSALKSKLMTFIFPPENVLPGIHELEGCKVEYQ